MSRANIEIKADWIDYWAGDYPDDVDVEVLDVVGPRVRKERCYDQQDLLTVGRWKARGRTQPRLAANTDELIHDVTATALQAPLSIQHRILTLLYGVRVPTATALLMVWDQDKHTVLDVRAVASLVAHGEIDDPAPREYPPYLEYLTACKRISQRCSRSLRTVDRALYRANGAL